MIFGGAGQDCPRQTIGDCDIKRIFREKGAHAPVATVADDEKQYLVKMMQQQKQHYYYYYKIWWIEKEVSKNKWEETKMREAFRNFFLMIVVLFVLFDNRWCEKKIWILFMLLHV